MAGGGKETPRQKMIGMMYLVLTALLAMNVSKDILMTFVTVDESLEQSNENFTKNSTKVMEGFKDAAASTPSAKPYYEKALEATKMTSDLFNYIDKLKHEVIGHVAAGQLKDGGNKDTFRLRFVDSKDDVNSTTGFLIGHDETHPENGEFSALHLKEQMQGVHDKLMAMVESMQKDPKTKLLQSEYETLKKKIETIKPDTHGEKENGVDVDWSVLNFYHAPLAGVITFMTKLQSDVKIVEADVVAKFSAASGNKVVKFDKLGAKVVAGSSYILSGQKYAADIYISAGSSAFTPDNMQVIVNPTSYDTIKGEVTGGTVVPLVDGMGKFEVGTAGEGDQKYKGVIKLKQPTGEFKLYPFESSYTVAKQAVAVSPDYMNVFYKGLPNPISISAAGVNPANLIVTASNGVLSKTGPGKYELKPSTPGKCIISVSAKGDDGTKKQGDVEFKVKPVPTAMPNISGKGGSFDMKKTELAVVGGITANPPGFDFKANYKVISFNVGVSVSGVLKQETVQGPNLTAGAKSIINLAKPGSKVFFDEFKVQYPDGSVVSQNIPPIVVKVK